jgi:glycine/sarcosine N-methyltransferase
VGESARETDVMTDAAMMASFTRETLGYYQRVAACYSDTVPDWLGAVGRQALSLDSLLTSLVGHGPLSILDCTCGIGTQTLGLAARGHRVVGTDVSSAAIDEARAHADRLGLDVSFDVLDVRQLGTGLDQAFDAVVSADNSLPHLLSEEDLGLAAVGAMCRLRPDGLLLASIRDYDRHLSSRPSCTTPQVWDDAEGRHLSFQTWDWLDQRLYRSCMFVLDEVEGEWSVRSAEGAIYRAWLRSEVAAILVGSGFVDVKWRLPADTGFHQPIVTARPPTRVPRQRPLSAIKPGS